MEKYAKIVPALMADDAVRLHGKGPRPMTLVRRRSAGGGMVLLEFERPGDDDRAEWAAAIVLGGDAAVGTIYD